MRHSLIALAVVAAACSTTGQKNPYPPRTASEKEQYVQAVKGGRIVLGMTKAEARRSWGKPMKKNRFDFRGQDVERWMYAFSEFYFDRWGRVVGFRGPG